MLGLVTTLKWTHNQQGTLEISLDVFYLRVPVKMQTAHCIYIKKTISALSMPANLSFFTTSPRE